MVIITGVLSAVFRLSRVYLRLTRCFCASSLNFQNKYLRMRPGLLRAAPICLKATELNWDWAIIREFNNIRHLPRGGMCATVGSRKII